MQEFNVDSIADNKNLSKLFYVSGKGLWALVLSTILVLSLWKNHNGILSIVLSLIVIYQSHTEHNKSKTKVRYLLGVLLFTLFMMFSNGKEVIIKFSRADVFNLPLWFLPYLIILISSVDAFDNIENFKF